MTTSTVNHWIVGAAKSGNDDHYDDFIRDGYWKLFWADEDTADLTPAQLSQVTKSGQIERGDRIAIKKKVGGAHDQGKILIRALGIVEKVSRVQNKVRVSWLHTGLDQVVAGTGWGRSIHGPFTLDDKNIREVFSPISELPLSQSKLANDLKSIMEKKIDRTTKEALIDARVGQGKFRTEVLQLWNNRCAVTGSCVLEAVRASHIKPWRKSTDEERLDPSNGLPLAAHLDALFDAGLISFEDAGRVSVSSKLSESEREIYSLVRQRLKIRPANKTIDYLRIHRTTVFRA